MAIYSIDQIMNIKTAGTATLKFDLLTVDETFKKGSQFCQTCGEQQQEEKNTTEEQTELA